MRQSLGTFFAVAFAFMAIMGGLLAVALIVSGDHSDTTVLLLVGAPVCWGLSKLSGYLGDVPE